MNVSCGFLIIDKNNKLILACHPTGHGYEFDVPKGHKNDNETDFECAIRELYEETGIQLPKDTAAFDCGRMPYLNNKDIHLYIYKMDLQSIISSLKCSSLIDSGPRKGLPEMDGYELFENYKNFYISLHPIIEDCLKKFYA